MIPYSKEKFLISPSILAADFSTLTEEMPYLENAGIKYLHYDVMDNHFVPQLTFGYKFVADYNAKTSLLADVHLMIENADKGLDEYLNAGSDIITFHVETMDKKRITSALEKVKNSGKFAGLSIKPLTDVQILEPYLDLLDMILVMTVEPGFGGQKLIPECLQKIEFIRNMLEKRNSEAVIQADGGINMDNVKQLFERGCTFFVMGSAFFREKDYNEFMKRLSEIL